LHLTPCTLKVQLGGLEVVRTVVQDSPHKLFIGGLPCDWTEEQVGQAAAAAAPCHTSAGSGKRLDQQLCCWHHQ
jgi:hypothetical protein